MICPFGFNKYADRPDCSSKCSLYDNGCLIAKALKTYIKVNFPIMAYNEKAEGCPKNDIFSKYPPIPLVETYNNKYYDDGWAGPVGYD